ncbi:Glutathione-specific gamma-glutamylcyclotransferase 1 [Desmophyllum pertusum]|uniref:Glutathione-specific gamma-glutamylcyclotransferase 1 n=1 Tax=Desmophyllum pertusum TaxID=174260 RepID=A0A9X0D7W4_9CNID|nr:Glutathione-specific gamma-glutamylcyclotransferase 1 [Desmophyllum pertusum]
MQILLQLCSGKNVIVPTYRFFILPLDSVTEKKILMKILMPGRVVTLVEEKQGRVWGIAFKVAKENSDRAMGKLNEREIALGGYELRRLRFSCNEKPSHSFCVLVYAATPKNTLYLGPATLEQIAVQIASARGHSGLNVEYLIRLADFMREKVPEFDEEHLFELEKLVRKELGLSTEVIVPWSQLKSTLIK